MDVDPAPDASTRSGSLEQFVDRSLLFASRPDAQITLGKTICPLQV
jgi:hypothetical protein